jgi:hypothetical protein
MQELLAGLERAQLLPAHAAELGIERALAADQTSSSWISTDLG